MKSTISIRLIGRVRTFALLGCLLFSHAIAHRALGAFDDDTDPISLAKKQAQSMAFAFHSASEKMLPSVVTVLAKRQDVDETLDELNLLNEKSEKDFNIGSGVILSESGLCVTNNHVIQGAKSIRVRLSDGRAYMAKDVRTDPKSDIAVFQIVGAQSLPAATQGDSEALRIGDWVLAIGSPFALDQTVSVGIISSKGRTMSLLQGQLLQTDATINPGNSGGALLDIHGNLVGINTLISTTNGQFQGVGFAIPMRRVQWLVKELTEQGKVRRSILGVKVITLPQDVAERQQLTVGRGVYVASITPNQPADKTGLLVGDVVLELAGQSVRGQGDFLSLVEQLPADRSYPIKFWRDGSIQVLEIQPIVVDK